MGDPTDEVFLLPLARAQCVSQTNHGSAGSSDKSTSHEICIAVRVFGLFVRRATVCCSSCRNMMRLPPIAALHPLTLD